MKDTLLVNDLFDVEDEFFNHQLFSKLIEKEHFEEVIHLINQQKIDPYKTFQFKKVRTRETIFTCLFKEALETNNAAFIENILTYKPITKTSMKPLMKKVDLFDLIISNQFNHSLEALNKGKNLSILASVCEDPILIMQKAYLANEKIYGIIAPHFQTLLPEYQLFLTLISNQEKDIVNLSQNDLIQPLKVFEYCLSIYSTQQKVLLNYLHQKSMNSNDASTALLENQREFANHYISHFRALIQNTFHSGNLSRFLLSTDTAIYPSTLALLMGHDEVYCSLHHQTPNDEFKKQTEYNQKLLFSLNDSLKNDASVNTGLIMLERYKLDASLFSINDLNGKKAKRVKI